MGRILSTVEKRIVSSFYAIQSAEFMLYRVETPPNRISISFHLYYNSRTRSRSSLTVLHIRRYSFFLRIYFPKDVASEIFQGLISPGINFPRDCVAHPRPGNAPFVTKVVRV